MSSLADLAAQKRGHSIYAPSSAAAWLSCLGSLVAAALEPDRPNFYSAEGSVAHHVADTWLRSGERPTHLVGTTMLYDGFEILIDDVMLAYVKEYVDDCMLEDGDHYYETQVDLSSVMPIAGQGGTADFFALQRHKGKTKDFKYGKGIKVSASYDVSQLPALAAVADAEGRVPNPQLALYSLGVFLEWDWYYDFQTFRLEVHQPRLDHVDFYDMSRADVLAFADLVRARAAAAWIEDAPRTPSAKACETCNVRTCAAKLAWVLAVAEHAADDVFGVDQMAQAIVTAEDPFHEIVLPELSLQAKAAVFPLRGAIEKWFAEMGDDLFAAAIDGHVPGQKLVDGRSRREWSDELEAVARMEEVGIVDPYNHKVFSPNQAEEYLHAKTQMKKSAAKKLLDEYTTTEQGGLSLVPISDKRKAVTNGVDFDAMISGD